MDKLHQIMLVLQELSIFNLYKIFSEVIHQLHGSLFISYEEENNLPVNCASHQETAYEKRKE